MRKTIIGGQKKRIGDMVTRLAFLVIAVATRLTHNSKPINPTLVHSGFVAAISTNKFYTNVMSIPFLYTVIRRNLRDVTIRAGVASSPSGARRSQFKARFLLFAQNDTCQPI
jgi:hypothetical protein